MTEEVETTPVKRTRTRKAKENPSAVAVENPGPAPAEPWQVMADQLKAMQEQNMFFMQKFMEMAEKMGRDPREDLPRPPAEVTVVEETEQPPMLVAEPAKEANTKLLPYQKEGRPQPGSLLGNEGDRNRGWVAWSKNDLDPDEYIDFVPLPVPGMVFPMEDEEGRQKIRLDVNDLVCWLTVGIPNRVNKMFYYAYMDGLGAWKRLEHLKRHGPDFAPWGRTGPDGRPAWHFEPNALSFGLDDDGHYLVRGGLRNPLNLTTMPAGEETEPV